MTNWAVRTNALSDATKATALAKLERVRVMVGYPECEVGIEEGDRMWKKPQDRVTIW